MKITETSMTVIMWMIFISTWSVHYSLEIEIKIILITITRRYFNCSWKSIIIQVSIKNQTEVLAVKIKESTGFVIGCDSDVTASLVMKSYHITSLVWNITLVNYQKQLLGDKGLLNFLVLKKTFSSFCLFPVCMFCLTKA